MQVYRHDIKKITASARDQGLGQKRRVDIWPHFTVSPSGNKTQSTDISEETPCGSKLRGKKTSNLKRHLKAVN